MKQVKYGIFLLLIFSGLAIAGVDKSGVKPNVLSLPSGPGSIEGLGESFEPQLNNGTSRYRVPIDLPPGRAGFLPDVALVYNNGYGNGPEGMGWRLDLPFIQRQTDKGLPLYTMWPDNDQIDNDNDGLLDEYDEYDTFIYSSGEELVPVDAEYWRFENESEFFRFEKLTEGWIVKRPDGTILKFGITDAERVENGNRRFRWHLSEMQDLNGNTIKFSYEKLGDGLLPYLRSISYNDSKVTILINYESRPDIIVDYRPRFELKTSYRCSSIEITTVEGPVRKYKIEYEPTSSLQPLSLLSSITEFGRDGVTSLPSASFTYTTFGTELAQAKLITESPNLSLDDDNVDLMDIDGDGLPDILDTSQQPHSYYLNRGPDSSGHIKWANTTLMDSAIGLFLGADSTRIADMDADGRSDILDVQTNQVAYYSVDQTINWSSPEYVFGAGFSFNDKTVKLLDVNNDKRVDVIQSAGQELFVWHNLEDGNWSNRYTTSLPNNLLQLDSDNTKLADMNGDRLIDLVFIEQGTAYYYPSKGYGEFDPQVRINNAPLTIIDPKRLFLSDVNGDGRSDAIYIGGTIQVWLNLGLDPQDHSRANFADPITVSSPYLNTFITFRQADINANGSTDIVWNTNLNGPVEIAYVDFSPNEQPYQLKSITNGIGRTTTISYRSSTLDMIRDRDAGAPWPETIPFPISVVSQVITNDGLQSYATENAYHNGYYDGAEKEFRGFSNAEQRDLGDATIPDLLTRFTFDTGVTTDALKGKLLATQAENNNGEIFYRETNSWETRQLLSGVIGDTRQVTFPFTREKLLEEIEKDPASSISLKWEYEFDDFGNSTRLHEHGRLDGGWDDERITQSTYSASNEEARDSWILNKLVRRVVSDENGQKASEKRLYYDGNLGLGVISKSNLTREDQWISQDKGWQISNRNDYDVYGNIIAAYDGLYGSQTGHYRTMEYENLYHTFPIKEVVHTGNAGVPTLTMLASYDAGFGVMTSSTDFNNHTSVYGYDTFGRLSKIIKPGDSGAKPTIAYDYVQAFDLGGGKLINWVETRERETAGGGTIDSRSYYDGLGRKVMTRSEGETANQIVVSDTVQYNARKLPWKNYLPYFETGNLDFVDPSYDSGFTEHHYDALGRKIRVVQPDGTFSSIAYNPLQKVVLDEEQTDPASDYYGSGMRYVEDGLRDEDDEGRLREVYEIVNINDVGEPTTTPFEWKTVYRYDLLNNLIGYTDSQNNQKLIRYDGLSRKIFMNDPDRGVMVYEYDDADNLVKTTDAKGQVIRYEYDGVNRISKEFYSAANSPDVTYHYDEPYGAVGLGKLWRSNSAEPIKQVILSNGEYSIDLDINDDGQIDVADLVKAETESSSETRIAENTRGNLAWVQDLSGEEHRSFDARGRVSWVVKRIKDNSGQLHNYFGGMSYDSMDRVKTQTYPDKTQTSYEYNARGLLERIPGVIDSYDYNPVGQNLNLTLNNGVATSYQYDDRLRLKNLRTLRSADVTLLQDLSYNYDAVSNINTIIDNRSESQLAAIGEELGLDETQAQAFNSTQNFNYDSLYRLIQAKNDNVYGSIDYRYDRIGNMVLKQAALTVLDPVMDLGIVQHGGTAGSYSRIGRNAGDQPGPHAITNTENTIGEILYDDNGNMVAEGNRQYGWDLKDRLVSLKKGQTQTLYTYDYTDTRKYKLTSDGGDHSQSEVIYIDKFSEVRKGKLIKYLYAGEIRVARLEANLNSMQTQAFYLHDHLGTTNLTLDNGGQVLEQIATYPFGRSRMQGKINPELRNADYQFIGKEEDQESGLQYFEARYYLPSISFASVDAGISGNLLDRIKSSPQQLNTYSYSSNKPVTHSDQDGNWAHIAVGGLVGGGINVAIHVFTDPNWTGGSAIGSFVSGAITGGVGAATFGLGTTAVVGRNLVAGVGGEFANQVIRGGPMNTKDIAISGLSNAVGGAMGSKLVGGKVNKLKAVAQANLKRAKQFTNDARIISKSAYQSLGNVKSQEGIRFSRDIHKIFKADALKFQGKAFEAERALNKAIMLGTGIQTSVDETISNTVNNPVSD